MQVALRLRRLRDALAEAPALRAPRLALAWTCLGASSLIWQFLQWGVKTIPIYKVAWPCGLLPLPRKVARCLLLAALRGSSAALPSCQKSGNLSFPIQKIYYILDHISNVYKKELK